MKAIFPAVLCVFLAFTGGACRRHDIRTVDIRTPGIRCADCAALARRAILGLDGVRRDDLVIDVETGITRVTYDSLRLALKNLEHALNDAGFDANDMPASLEAVGRLPDECREHAD